MNGCNFIFRKTFLFALIGLASIFNFSLAFGKNETFQKKLVIEDEGEMFEKISILPEPKSAKYLFAEGDKLYSVGKEGLHIFDISKPSTPRLLGKFSDMGEGRQIVVQNLIAYVTARESGLYIIDVKTPESPKLLSRYDSIEFATGLDVAGDVAFLGLRTYGVEFVNVSKPEKPRHIRLIKTSESQSVRYSNGILYSGDWAKGEITAIDVRDISKAKIISLTKLDGFGDGIDVRNKLLFAATGHHAKLSKSKPVSWDTKDPEFFGKGHGLEIFDLKNPAEPQKISNVKFPPTFSRHFDMWQPLVCENYVIVSDATNGVFVVNIADVKNPKTVSRIRIKDEKEKDFPSSPVGGVAAANGAFYVAAIKEGIIVALSPKIKTLPRDFGALPKNAEYADPYKTDESKFSVFLPDERVQVRSVALYKNYAFVACSTGGMYLVKIMDDGSLKKIEKIKGISEAYDVKVADEKLYVAEGTDGISSYTIREKNGKIDLNSDILLNLEQGENAKRVAHYIWAYPKCKYVAYSYGKSEIFFADFSEFAKPSNIFAEMRKPLYPRVKNIQTFKTALMYLDYLPSSLLEGKYLTGSWHSSGFAWYEIGEKGVKQTLAAKEPKFSHACAADFFKDRALLPMRDGYTFVEPNKSHKDAKIIKYPKGVKGGVTRTCGDFVAFNLRVSREMFAMDLSDMENPKAVPERSYKFTGNQNAPVFYKGKMLIPAGYQGLLLEK